MKNQDAEPKKLKLNVKEDYEGQSKTSSPAKTSYSRYSQKDLKTPQLSIGQSAYTTGYAKKEILRPTESDEEED